MIVTATNVNAMMRIAATTDPPMMAAVLSVVVDVLSLVGSVVGSLVGG